MEARVSSEERFMQKALELAARSPFTSPNPKVGAVVVRDGSILGEGFHRGAGHAHAEAVALDGVDASGATLFVTLEPCTHEGRTAPCAPLVAESGVARVVVASLDPDERVSGRGVQFLRERGVDLEVGVLEADARLLNASFIHHRLTGRPMVTLKLALTLDGRLAAPDGSSQWITGAEARRIVHERRASVDALLVGAGTVLTDDPSLTARDVDATRQPVKVVVDTTGRIGSNARVFSGPGDLIIATTSESAHESQIAWKEAGAELLVLDRTPEGVDLGALVAALGRRGFLELLCEGGGELATSLLRDGLVDRLSLFYGPVVTGRGGPDIGDLDVDSLSDVGRWVTYGVQRLGDDLFVELNSQSLDALLQPVGEQA